MNKNTYTFEERFLAWLFQERNGPNDEVQTATPLASAETHLELDPLYSEGWIDEVTGINPDNMHHYGEITSRSSGHEPLKLGARSVVQERFYNLLKQRFQQEMEASPPLFPWETELVEYEDVVAVSSGIAAWEPQLRQLRLPVTLPTSVLETLFQRCQALTQSALQDGRRLVEAVESLFPDESQSLNALAGTMLLGYSRDGEAMADRLLGNNVPESYEAAPHQQQMTLAMIAAYEMLNRLTLKLTDHEPNVTQAWETASGTVHLKAEKISGDLLRIEATIPESGRVTVSNGASSTQSQRDGEGVVTLLIDGIQANQTYQVQVSLLSADDALGFAVQL